MQDVFAFVNAAWQAALQVETVLLAAPLEHAPPEAPATACARNATRE